MKYTLPNLPYAYGALEPHIAREIMELHHSKHHQAYVNGANTALDKLEQARKNNFQGVDVRAIERDLSFHLSGHILHSIFWPNMKPSGGGKPGGTLADMINASFGSFDAFKAQFTETAKSVEGIGWAMLVYEPSSNQLLTLNIEKHNMQAAHGTVPLLVLDVWEHAYYLQYKNDRASYINAWWNVVNWDDADARLRKSKV
ncbi:MAG: superoxide dismutase [Candidatus Nitrosocaldus sp.]|nr:superoxide dismutase [Candidatus Nitrosocaldus sp.]MCS7141286.1 superoxide dismutase [Candidatus Nitrosocaldus sp.]MDW8000251.1 superoxide dismutase [Candidatus Nitrosocaldus sp.]MDW8276123.1 superoxide dismutase [Candidatus Nitrosocaldus sp.]